MGTDRSSFSRGNARNAGSRGNGYSQNKFVRLELTKAQQAECKGWCATLGEFSDFTLNLAEDGYKFNCKWDNYSNAHACFVQRAVDGDGHINEGLCLTGRGSSPFKAIKQALYKHFIVLEGVWGELAGASSAAEIDD